MKEILRRTWAGDPAWGGFSREFPFAPWKAAILLGQDRETSPRR